MIATHLRLVRLHLWSLYIAAALAVGAVAFKGVGVIALAIFVPLAILSHFAHKRGLPERLPVNLWNALLLGLIALTGVQLYTAGEDTPLLDIGVRFIVFLLLLKLWSRRGVRDEWQVWALTFLLMAAGTTVNEDVLYGLLFTLYVPICTFGLALFHLRSETEQADAQASSQPLSRVYMGALALIAGLVFLSSVALFFVFPRVGLGFFAPKIREANAMVGFSDTVELGRHGAIRDNPQVALRVEFLREIPPSYNDLHWRMMGFDHYDGSRWSRTSKERGQPVRRMTVQEWDVASAQLSEGMRALLKDAPAFPLRVYMEPLGARQLPALWPVASVRPTTDTLGIPFDPKFANLYADPHGDLLYIARNEVGVAYDMTVLQPPPPQALIAASNAELSEHEERSLRRYLQLPPDMERLRGLAAQITKDKPATPWARADAIQSYLNGAYTYTTDLPRVDPKNPVEDFLFRTKTGHCEFFATSMALLLRATGVHARVVNGFLGGTWNDIGGYLAVRQGDAHSWVEVYYPGLGWVPYDPTPSDGRVGFQDDAAAKLWRSSYDAIKMQWNRLVIEYDLGVQISALRTLSKALSPSRDLGGAAPESGPQREAQRQQANAEALRPWLLALGLLVLTLLAAQQGGQVRRRAVWITALILAALTLAGALWAGRVGSGLIPAAPLLGGLGPLLAGGGVAALLWRRGEAAADAETLRVYFVRLERALARAGLERAPDEGPSAFLARAQAAQPGASAAIAAFASLYLAARFGGAPVPIARLDAAQRAAQAALVR
jgi:protein-glutamine gamma-glutamyltransferase